MTNASAAGGRRLPARQSSRIERSRRGASGTIATSWPGISANVRGSTASPSPRAASARTISKIADSNATRGTARAWAAASEELHEIQRAALAQVQFDARVHGALYAVEHGLDGTFEARVAQGLAGAALRGWPGPREGAWLVVDDERLAGGIGLTDEGGDVGRVRWFLLAPVLRGHGLGRQLLDGLVDHARAHDLRRLELETFGALRAAAHLYTGAGFVLTDAERRVCWGRQIELRHYALDLG